MTFFSCLFLFCILLCSLLNSQARPRPPPSLPSTDITDFFPPCPLSFCVFLMDLSGLMPGQTPLEFSLFVGVLMAVEGRKLAVRFTIAEFLGKS